MARHYDHLMLMRIIDVLFALAVLAERSISDSLHKRRLVLLFLRPAEAVARGLLAGEGGERSLKGMLFPLDGDGPEHARRLALCFRALALTLIAVLAQFPLSGIPPTQACGPWLERCRLARHLFGFAPATIPDTS